MSDPNKHLQPGIELLGDSEGSGHLNVGEDGRAFRQLNDAGGPQRPSLEGSGQPQGQARGIGGTVLSSDRSMEQPNASSAGHVALGQPTPHAPDLTPEQMMHLANAMEQDQMEAAVMAKAEQQMGKSSVSGSLDHGQGQYVPPSDQPPSWLNDYMAKQPFTDPYHQTPMSGLDAIKGNKYLTERERLKYTRSLRK